MAWWHTSAGVGSLRFLLGTTEIRVAMSEGSIRSNRLSFYLLTLAVSVGAGIVLFVPAWAFPEPSQTKYWNGLVAFALLGIDCDSSFLPLTRITSANVRSSVAFIPLLASVLLFHHPW